MSEIIPQMAIILSVAGILIILGRKIPAVLDLSEEEKEKEKAFQDREKNGRIFYGDGFGATSNSKVTGEVVFTTFTAAGYNCALTDPSNQGQIYTLTYPLIGNYGVPAWEKDTSGIHKWFESNSIKCSGFVVHEKCNCVHFFSLNYNPKIKSAGEGIRTLELLRE